QEAIRRAWLTISASLSVDGVLGAVTEHSRQIIGAHQAVGRFVSDTGTATAVSRSDHSRGRAPVDPEPRESDLDRLVRETNRPLRLTRADLRTRAARPSLAGVAAVPSRGWLAVPLVGRDGRNAGLVRLTDRRAGEFTAEDEALLVQLAELASGALANVATLETAQHGRDTTARIAEVTRALTESLDLAEVARRVVESVQSLFRREPAGLRLLEPDGSLRGIAWAGPAAAHFPAGHTIPPGFGMTGRAMTEKRAVWTRNVLDDPEVRLTDDLRAPYVAAGVSAVLAVPVRLGEQCLGTLSVGDPAPRAFGDEEAVLLQLFADQAAVAVGNAHLHAQASRRRREAEVLSELARTIGESLDLPTVLSRVAHGARELCASDRAAVAIREPGADSVLLRYWSGASRSTAPPRMEPGQGVGGRVLQTGRPFRTDHFAADPRVSKEYLAWAAAEGIIAAMAVPIGRPGALEGVLFVQNRTPRPFTDQDEAVLVR